MNAGWANIVLTMHAGGFPSRRRLRFIVVMYSSAVLAVLLGIALAEL